MKYTNAWITYHIFCDVAAFCAATNWERTSCSIEMCIANVRRNVTETPLFMPLVYHIQLNSSTLRTARIRSRKLGKFCERRTDEWFMWLAAHRYATAYQLRYGYVVRMWHMAHTFHIHYKCRDLTSQPRMPPHNQCGTVFFLRTNTWRPSLSMNNCVAIIICIAYQHLLRSHLSDVDSLNNLLHQIGGMYMQSIPDFPESNLSRQKKQTGFFECAFSWDPNPIYILTCFMVSLMSVGTNIETHAYTKLGVGVCFDIARGPKATGTQTKRTIYELLHSSLCYSTQENRTSVDSRSHSNSVRRSFFFVRVDGRAESDAAVLKYRCQAACVHI